MKRTEHGGDSSGMGGPAIHAVRQTGQRAAVRGGLPDDAPLRRVQGALADSGGGRHDFG